MCPRRSRSIRSRPRVRSRITSGSSGRTTVLADWDDQDRRDFIKRLYRPARGAAPGWLFLILATHELALALRARSTDPRINGWCPRSRSTEDKATGVVFGLIVRAEDSDSRSDSQENDSRPLIQYDEATEGLRTDSWEYSVSCWAGQSAWQQRRRATVTRRIRSTPRNRAQTTRVKTHPVSGRARSITRWRLRERSLLE